LSVFVVPSPLAGEGGSPQSGETGRATFSRKGRRKKG
jgi:hypothetical protein